MHPYFGSGGAEKGIISLSLLCRRKSIATSLFALRTNNEHILKAFDKFYLSRATRSLFAIPALLGYVKRADIDVIVVNQAFAICIFCIPIYFYSRFLLHKDLKLVAF